MKDLNTKSDSNHKSYHCKYCGKIMSSYDYENYNGYCGNCRTIRDWKKLLDDTKKFTE